MTPNSHDKLLEILTDCREYFDDRADTLDGPAGTPYPNDEMQLLAQVDEAIDLVKRDVPIARRLADQDRSLLIPILLLTALLTGCGSGSTIDVPVGPTPPATQPVCTQVYHPEEVHYVGHNTWIKIPAWVETVCRG